MENKIKGGKSDKMSLEDIARKHSVFLGTIQKQLEMGLKVEKEHTKDESTAREIAMDHLSEFPDYYTRLDKMENKAKKTIEAKECTGADASGSVEGPIFGKTILKRDIHKLHNSKPIEEQMDSSVSAGAMYDGPVGTAGPSSPMDKTKKKRKDPLALDEKTKTASITAASNNDMISTKKGFPRFGGPDAKFVEINPKCKDALSNCNQGADSDGAWKTPQNIKLKEAIERAAKKYKISIEEVRKIIMKEAYDLPAGIDFKPALSWGKDKGTKYIHHLTTIDPLDLSTKDEIMFEKLKLALRTFDIKFKEDKRPITSEDDMVQVSNTSQDDDDDFEDDPSDNIFANIK